ncbi:MAG: hypothetical protein HOQ05_02040 [Corynebacteriales bacterium]|nr:hypothetical protein [Mycobacteriales bacterium]
MEIGVSLLIVLAALVGAWLVYKVVKSFIMGALLLVVGVIAAGGALYLMAQS